MLVVQPAGSLHFPAAEALREAVASRALEGAWARQRVTPRSPRPLRPSLVPGPALGVSAVCPGLAPSLPAPREGGVSPALS